MTLNTHGLLAFGAYIAVFFCALIWVSRWDRRKRRTKLPLPQNLKLLRMPGEFLWRKVIQQDDSEMQWFMGAMLVPLLGGLTCIQLLSWFVPQPTLLMLILPIMVTAFLLLLVVRFLVARLRRRADDYLGFFGERFTAECLEPLKREGWFVFHDVPFDGATGPFNIDHVAVGSGGVWAIETKTFRKGKPKPGRKDHEVQFDGRQVIWPWTEESESLDQASRDSTDLRDWLKQRLNRDFDVRAILTSPGYFVTERALGAVRVVNPKNLPQVVTGRGKTILVPADIDLICRQLEDKCRNVDY